MKLRLTSEWLRKQEKHERYILGGDVSPDTHDAAAAHALVMALTEHFTSLNHNYVQGDDDVSRRADEILAGWGYSE